MLLSVQRQILVFYLVRFLGNRHVRDAFTMSKRAAGWHTGHAAARHTALPASSTLSEVVFWADCADATFDVWISNAELCYCSHLSTDPVSENLSSLLFAQPRFREVSECSECDNIED